MENSKIKMGRFFEKFENLSFFQKLKFVDLTPFLEVLGLGELINHAGPFWAAGRFGLRAVLGLGPFWAAGRFGTEPTLFPVKDFLDGLQNCSESNCSLYIYTLLLPIKVNDK